MGPPGPAAHRRAPTPTSSLRWVGEWSVARLHQVIVLLVLMPVAARWVARTSDSMASRRLLFSNFFAAASPPELMRRILILSRSMAPRSAGGRGSGYAVRLRPF